MTNMLKHFTIRNTSIYTKYNKYRGGIPNE